MIQLTDKLQQDEQRVLETDRLVLRRFVLTDAGFIFALLNSPNWLAFLGDRGIRTLQDAENYLLTGSLKSYTQNGFGFYAVVEKATQATIGMCGLIKRDFLEQADLGYAFLPEYTGKGFAAEAAAATVEYALNTLNFKQLLAVVNPANEASVRLLCKIGMQFERMMPFENQLDPVALYVIEK